MGPESSVWQFEFMNRHNILLRIDWNALKCRLIPPRARKWRKTSICAGTKICKYRVIVVVVVLVVVVVVAVVRRAPALGPQAQFFWRGRGASAPRGRRDGRLARRRCARRPPFQAAESGNPLLENLPEGLPPDTGAFNWNLLSRSLLIEGFQLIARPKGFQWFC